MTIASEITRITNAKAAIKTSIEGKGVTVPAATKISGYSSLIDQISQGGGGSTVKEDDVTFYDYDGTILYSYSAADFLNLTVMPDNPDRTSDGLTADGWNWNLADAQDYVAYTGGLSIGQIYHPTDHKNHIFIELLSFTTISLGIGINGTATVEWGDGSSETITGNSGGAGNFPHTYDSIGKYEIKILVTSGTLSFRGGSSGSSTIRCGTDYVATYQATIKKMYISDTGTDLLGDNRGYAFKSLSCLRAIVIPNTILNLGQYPFYSCYSLQCLILPNSVTTTIQSSGFYFNYRLKVLSLAKSNILTSLSSSSSLDRICFSPSQTTLGNNLFQYNQSVREIFLPNTITSIGNGSFNNNLSLTKIKIPQSVTSIGGGVFTSCTALTRIDLSDATAVPTAGSTPFPQNVGMQILVPQALLSSFQSATNWSTYASYMVGV